MFLNYKTSVLDATDAAKLMDRFLDLLRFAVGHPDAALSRFPDYTGEDSSVHPVRPAREIAAEPATVKNMLEQEIIEIWRDQFPSKIRKTIGAETDFFALGGDSMQAARMFARLDREFGVQWPLSTLIKAPTPRLLAQHMSDRDEAAAWLSLIPLQTSGSRIPLYFMPGGGGNMLCFRQITACLGADQPVYCLQAKGLKRGERPLTSVEEMAAYYLEVIRVTRPHGPYILAGHSLGAVVAYEMARRLLEMGEEVPLLVLLDHGGPDLKFSVMDTLRYTLMNLFSLGPRELFHFLWTGTLWKLRAKAATRLRTPVAKPTEEEQNPYWSSGDTFQESIRALKAYHTPPFPGRAVLFRARQHPKMWLDSKGGWGRVIENGLEVVDIPGTHMTMLKEPHVQVVGTQLALCLDRIETELHD